MASNSFGKIFRMTTFGESHGSSMGVVIDGCPAGLSLNEEDIQLFLDLRAPGRNAFTSPRKEGDQAEIVSGIFEGRTTGAPICVLIANKDADSSKYDPVKHLLRPGHANFTYLEKYGVFDYRGGGRSSARETVCRVAAGAVARKLLEAEGISICAYLRQLGREKMRDIPDDVWKQTYKSAVYCPDPKASHAMESHLLELKEQGDSAGGIVELLAQGLPTGLGDPVYEKLEARLAYGMLSIPASKGFEIGSGFDAVEMLGSEHNDAFYSENGKITCKTNHAGGVLGGISTAMPLVCRVAFKPTSSISKSQDTCNLDGDQAGFRLPEGSRHDPCVAIRAVPVVEAMGALVLADALLMR